VKNTKFVRDHCFTENKQLMINSLKDYNYKYKFLNKHIKNKSSNKWNILFITIDALRYDKVENSKKKYTAPYLHALKREAIYFEKLHSPSSGTIGTNLALYGLSNTSFVDGNFDPAQPARGRISPTQDTFIKRLKNSGYQTAAIVSKVSSAHFNKSNNFAQGFDYFFQGTDRRDKSILKKSEKIIDKFSDEEKPWFVWIHFGLPHGPYSDDRFGKSARKRYEGEIRACNDLVKELLMTRLKSLRKNTIVFISSDHGEEFGEHGGYYHKSTIFQEVIHVPGILFWPKEKKQKVKENYLLTDILASMVRYNIGPQISEIISDGNKILQMQYPDSIFFEINGAHSIQAGIISNGLKIIYDYLQRLTFLYNLETDPKEEKNILEKTEFQQQKNAMLEKMKLYRDVRACFQKLKY
jgi:arylsulfatase A-like enzyme